MRVRRFLVLLVIAGISSGNTRYERRKSYKHTPYGSHIASTGSYTQNKVSSRRALHRATSSYDPSTSRRYYSSKVNSKSKKSKCLRGPIGPTGPEGPQGPAGPPGVCPSSCPDVTRTFPVKRNLLEKKSEKAAFQIALSNSAYTTLESVVIWDTIITNKGNMFSLSSGIFTASKPGFYFFAATGLQSDKRYPMSFSIMRGFQTDEDDYICTAQTPDQSFQSTSCQGVVELAVGQQVYVKLIKGGFHASKFHPSSFSGFQLD